MSFLVVVCVSPSTRCRLHPSDYPRNSLPFSIFDWFRIAFCLILSVRTSLPQATGRCFLPSAQLFTATISNYRLLLKISQLRSFSMLFCFATPGSTATEVRSGQSLVASLFKSALPTILPNAIFYHLFVSLDARSDADATTRTLHILAPPALVAAS